MDRIVTRLSIILALACQAGADGGRTDQDVLVVRDYLPWQANIAPLFQERGMTVTVTPSEGLSALPLDGYCLVFLCGSMMQSGDPYLANLNAARPHLEEFVEAGGSLLVETGTLGAVMELPGGVATQHQLEAQNLFTQEGPLSLGMPYPVFEGSSASHDRLEFLPAGATVWITAPQGAPTSAEYSLGGGHVLAMTQPLQCYLPGADCTGTYLHMRTLLDNAVERILELGGCSGTAVRDARPQLVELVAAHPNPFNPVTRLEFTLRRASPVRLSVYDVGGRMVHQWESAGSPAGRHSVDVDGSAWASGVYLARLEAGGEAQTTRLALVR